MFSNYHGSGRKGLEDLHALEAAPCPLFVWGMSKVAWIIQDFSGGFLRNQRTLTSVAGQALHDSSNLSG